MNKLSINLRKTFLTIMLLVALLMCSIIGIMSGMSVAHAYTYSKTSTVSVDNGDFTEYVVMETGTPYSITDKHWTLTTTGGVVGGVIDTSDSTFDSNNKFGLSANPRIDESIKTPDNYVLMFRASTFGIGKAKSESVTISSDTFYDVSIRAKNANGGQGYIVFNLDGEDYSLPVVTSEWNTYHLLVATDIYNSSSLNLSLYLNKNSAQSTGETFFDHIEINEISHLDFYSTSSSYYVAKADLTATRSASAVSNFTNSDFNDGMNGWENKSVVSSGDYDVNVYSLANINSLIAQNFDVSGAGISRSYRFGEAYSLLILNKDKVTTNVQSTAENLLTIPQHSYYRLTLIVKTGNMSSSSFQATLTPTNEDISPLTVSQSSMSSSKDTMNGFASMNIFIKGSVQDDESVSLSMGINDASGYAIVDSIELVPITMTEYNNNGTDSTKIDLSPSYIKDTSNLSNGRFDFSSSNNIEVKYPLAPENWTFSGTTNESGLIRINPSKFILDAVQYGSPTNPGIDTVKYSTIDADYYNENVLMLRNRSNEDIYYISAEKSVSSKASTVRFTINVKTLDNAEAFVKVIDANNNVIACVEDINTNNQWQMVNVYVKNGISSISLRLVVGMEGNGSEQFVFFDNADYKTEEYKDGLLTSYANLLNNGFTAKTSSVVENTSRFKIYEANGFSIYSTMIENEAVYGIVDVRENSSLSNHTEAEDGYLLVINNDLNSYNVISTDYTYSLSNGNYYEISIYVKTDFSSATLNGDTYGAYIELVNVDEDGNIVIDSENTNKFENIVTTNTDNNGYVKYSIYVVSESDQKVKVLLGLGGEENLTEGTVFFDDLKVTDITMSEYAEKVADEHTIVSKVVEIPDESGDDDKPKDKEDSGINIFALMSSILLIIALAFAIAGVIIRRHIEKTPKKSKTIKNKPSYHKTPKEIDKRNIAKDLGEMRSSSLADLTKRRDSLQDKLDNLTSEYKEATKGDELVDEAKYKEYIKKANKIREEKEYLDSAIAYLQSEGNARMAERKEMRKRQKKSKQDLKDSQE